VQYELKLDMYTYSIEVTAILTTTLWSAIHGGSFKSLHQIVHSGLFYSVSSTH